MTYTVGQWRMAIGRVAKLHCITARQVEEDMETGDGETIAAVYRALNEIIAEWQ